MAMAVKEISFVEMMSAAQDLADLVLASEEMKNYIDTKNALDKDPIAQEKMIQFQKIKEQHEEVERFGQYHPDYKRVTQEYRSMRRELMGVPSVSNFKKAENTVDEMLYLICRTIANGVSENIKVPSDNPMHNLGGGGCSSGGCGTGGSCGCG